MFLLRNKKNVSELSSSIPLCWGVVLGVTLNEKGDNASKSENQSSLPCKLVQTH